MTIPNPNQLSNGDVLRLDYHRTAFDTDARMEVVVDSVREHGEETLITLLDEWGNTIDDEVSITSSGAYYSAHPIKEGPIDSIKIIGEVPPDFGKHYILFRPPPYRDHVLRKSRTGKVENVCKHNVDIHDGEKIREDKITRRQRSLINICADCHSHFEEHLREKLPEPMERGQIEEEAPFLCPSCGMPPESVEYVRMLRGMVSHHKDGNCATWPKQIYHDWRVEGYDR
ncbi:hypothetical protein [Halorubrum salinum]|uniref:hypothetical protein n=1 Tax=Halorubrum salinum TaxID=767517 RepID=UPI002112EEDE|nr:hypothetical protein [Halorubrum salinum]